MRMRNIILILLSLLATHSLFGQGKYTGTQSSQDALYYTKYKEGIEFSLKRDFDKAIISFTEAINSNATHPEAYDERGFVY